MKRLLLLFLLGPFGALFAAPPSLQLSGRVMSGGGQVLAGATVELVELSRTTTTDIAGEFKFADVPAGIFALTASRAGYTPVMMRISTAKATSVDFQLEESPVHKDLMVVTGTGIPEPVSSLSRSVGVIDEKDLEITRTVGFDESLNEIPGVDAESQNDTEEVRFAIRGRSERTTFGVRGIKLLVDGIPETDASGETTDLVGIDLGDVDRIEVVKGPMSARYGLGSSGVVQAFTRRGGSEPNFDFRSVTGSFGLNKEEASLGGGFRNRFFYFLDGSHLGESGYRQNSHVALNHFTGRVDYELTSRTEISFFGKVGDLESQLPGNLNRQQWLANPFQASPAFLAYHAQSNITRYQGAVQITHSLTAAQSLTGMFYGRSLEYELPEPGIFITGVRHEEGGSAKYSNSSSLRDLGNVFEVGGDYQFQHETRQDFNNLFGTRGSIMQRNEVRHVGNQSYFVFDRMRIHPKLEFIGGANYEHLRFTIDNHLVNPVISAGPLFQRANYQVGLAYHIASWISSYANVATGFEPPTMTEFGRSPTGTAGLNLSLKPERTLSYEGGLLTRLRGKAYLNLAIFRLRVDNEIVPTGIGYPQVSYENAGRTIHNGLEAGLNIDSFHGFELKSAFTYSDFYYETYANAIANFSGNRLPAIPRVRFYGQARYTHRHGLYGGLENQYVSKMFVNDANTALNNQYDLTSLYAGYHKGLEAVELSFVFRVDNLTNRSYAGYVVVNDQFGAYYYPGAPRNYTGILGLTFHIRRRI